MTSKAKANAAKAANEALDPVFAVGKETVEQVVKAGTAAAAKGYEKAAAINKESLETMAKGYDELAAFGKGNIEAAVAAGDIAAKGFEAVSGEVMALTRTCFEDGIAASRAVMGAKTYKEVVDLQGDYAQAFWHNYLATTTKLGELSIKLTGEALEPVNARFAAAVEKYAKPLSA